MADNVAVTAGVGTTISTEEVTTLNGGAVSAQHTQRVILAVRTADSTAVDLGKAEDVAHASGDVGIPALSVRKDTAAALAGTDGDYLPPITNARGATWVSIEDGAGGQVTSFGGGTEYTEDAAAAANPVGKATILVRADTPAGVASANGDNVAQRGTDYGAAFVQIVSSAGAFIDSFGTQYAEDAAHVSGNTGTLALVVRSDTAANTAGTDGDYSALVNDSTGRLWVRVGTIDAGTITTVSTVTTCSTVTTVSTLTGSGVAHDGVDSGNPHLIGYHALAHGTNPTAVAAADRTRAYANRHGIPWVIGGHPNVVTETVRVDDADGAQADTIILAASAGTKIVVTQVLVLADEANSAGVRVIVGFGDSMSSDPGTTGTTGILAEHPGVPAGGGFSRGDGSGILGVGGDGDDLRYSCEDPAGGGIAIVVSYYTIES